MADWQGMTLKETGTDATANDNVLLVTIENEGFSDYTIHCIAGTVDVEITCDGSNWSSAVPIVDLAGTSYADDQLTVGEVGIMIGPFEGLRVRKKGTTNPTTVAVLARG